MCAVLNRGEGAFENDCTNKCIDRQLGQDRDDDNESTAVMSTRNCNASESDYYLARRYYRLGGPDGAILTRYTISLSECGQIGGGSRG
jgi:hypothetical protein